MNSRRRMSALGSGRGIVPVQISTLEGAGRLRQPMSALGQKQTCTVQLGMSALPPIATAKAKFPQTVMSALGQKQHSRDYSITSSAQASSVGGRVPVTNTAAHRNF